MSEESLRGKFPSLEASRFRITSPATWSYTCIGYAAGDTERVWLPDPWPEGLFYWPPDVPREHTVDAWIQVFGTRGYQGCDSREFEPEVEKVAIYADADGAPQHVARQLPTGRWTSKLGKLEDVEHDLAALEGASYGSVVQVLARVAAES
ncbi:MAG: hypothetical protein ICV87_03780 [Gemmatimonadetes bacterium]|nr:hypothetical protein [Gemmatimonadota bacterium]